MPNSRIFLSVTALVVGAMASYALAALGVPSPGPWEGSANAVHGMLAVAAVFWIYLFRRQRGTRVVVSSRIWLSASALVVGAMLAAALVSWGAVPVLIFGSLSFLALYAVAILGYAVFWLFLFFRRRRAHKRGRETSAVAP